MEAAQHNFSFPQEPEKTKCNFLLDMAEQENKIPLDSEITLTKQNKARNFLGPCAFPKPGEITSLASLNTIHLSTQTCS